MSDDTPSPDAPTVLAVLGAGIMGAGMARSAAAAGLAVRVWNRSPERAEALADVATVCASAAEAVAGADVVTTMLLDADAVAEVAARFLPAVADGAVWLQTSTVGLEGTDRLAALAADHGVAFLDAPVLGTRGPAEKGQLVVLASGDASLRPRVQPVLDAIGQRTTWQDAVGDGSRLKLACNAWVLTVVEGIAESLTLAGALGIDPRAFLDAVSGGAMDAPYVQVKGSAMLDDARTGALDDTQFPLAGAAKDAGLVVAAARSAGLELEVAEAVQRRFARAAGDGQGGADLGATFRVARTRA